MMTRRSPTPPVEPASIPPFSTASAISDVTAVVLAGGLGTRLRSVLADRPKVLASVGGRPFLSLLLDQLRAGGLSHTVICTGHLGDQVEAAFGTVYRGIRLEYSRESEPLGTGGALRLALDRTRSDPLLVLNGDSFQSFDVAAFWQWHRSKDSRASVVVAHQSDTRRYGRVEIDESDRVVRFAEKTNDARPAWINAGIYLVSRALIASIPSGQPVSLEHEILPLWLKDLSAFRAEGAFVDIGTPEGFALANDIFPLESTP